jgi:hypothetical protein
MEIHSYQGSLDQLWNSTAMVGVHSYGIPEQIKTDSGVDCTHRFPARRRIQSCPGTYALFAQFLYDRAFPSPALARAWPSFSARLTIFSLGQKTRPHWSPEVLPTHEKFHCSKLARFA